MQEVALNQASAISKILYHVTVLSKNIKIDADIISHFAAMHTTLSNNSMVVKTQSVAFRR